MDCCVRLWFMFCEVLLNGVLRIQVRHFGDHFILPAFHLTEEQVNSNSAANHSPLPGTSSIFLLNHRTRLDWIFVFSLGEYARCLKIVLKHDLAKLPGVGWAMQLDAFIFLRRRIAIDLARIQQAVKYLLKLQGSAHILIFPEGTDLSVFGLKRSDAYAKKMNLPLYRYTLHPRTTGFETIIKELGSELGYVYDVTVAYPYALTESELAIALGACPQEVHFHVRRWAASQLPLSDKTVATNSNGIHLANGTSEIPTSTLAQWLQERWAEKEKMLKEYYANPPDERRFPGPEILREDAVIPSGPNRWSPAASALVFFWSLFLLFCFVLVWRYWLVRFYVLAMSTFLVYRGGDSGGLGEWLADLAGFPLDRKSPPPSTD
ncbi:hypothetical protein Aperf_G00000018052 [Anoplocephala perfoliata]